MNAQPPKSLARLERLQGFLERDPANLQLLGDAAAAAYDAGSYDLAAELLARIEEIAGLSEAQTNLKGMAALARGDHAAAAEVFEGLKARGVREPALDFNLAWSRAMMNDFKGALELLDDAVLAVSPRAPSLKIHAMHHLEMYDEALAAGEELAERFPGNRALMGALATLALDAEKPELAQHYAERAGDDPEAQAARGVLALGEDDTERSLALFEETIAVQPASPRAWMGKGLSLLAMGKSEEALPAIDKGAELFGDHLGSWIASGWTHFAVGDRAGARAAFERALAIDANFSESHGGLAVLDLLEGRLDDAKRRAQIAIRLDRNSLGGALASSLLLEAAGQSAMAERVRNIALNKPLTPGGRSIAQALTTLGPRMSKLKRT